jgi:hypothetical protein
MKRRRRAASLLLMSLAVLPALAAGEPRTWLQLHGTDARWRLSTDAGSLYASNPGTLVSTEGELGLPTRKAIPGIAFGRLIGERWRIEVEHTSARRRASTVLGGDLRRGETTFLAGTALEADVGLSTLRVNGGWAAWQTDSAQAVLLIGGQWLKISQRLNGTATVDVFPPGSASPVPGPPGPRSVDSSDLTPVGLLGLQLQWQPAPAWRVLGRAEAGAQQYLQLSAGAQWWPARNLALGAGYRLMRAELDSSFCFIGCSRFVSNLRIHGPQLSATLAF